MDERLIQVGALERPVGGERVGPASDPPSALADPRALQILSTEHWSLLTARSLVYNESFARGGMFLTFLSATLVALGLVSTATGFSPEFLFLAAGLLGLDIFIGLATLGRISSASAEDIRSLQAMSRIRHAYLEMVPGVARYISTPSHDDLASVLAIYGDPELTSRSGLLHGFTTMPGMIGVICAVLVGALVAVLLLIVGAPALVTGVAAALAFAVAMVSLIAVAAANIRRLLLSIEARFPRPPTGDR
jgi:hypothetical protein